MQMITIMKRMQGNCATYEDYVRIGIPAEKLQAKGYGRGRSCLRTLRATYSHHEAGPPIADCGLAKTRLSDVNPARGPTWPCAGFL